MDRSFVEESELWERGFAVHMRYDEPEDSFTFLMRSGIRVVIPRALINELKDFARCQIHEIELTNVGHEIFHKDLDLHLSVPDLVLRLSGYAPRPLPCPSACYGYEAKMPDPREDEDGDVCCPKGTPESKLCVECAEARERVENGEGHDRGSHEQSSLAAP